MKEILQTKALNLKSTLACASAHSGIPAFLHVENVVQEYVAVEVEDPAGAEGQEEQPQEFGVADQFEEQEPVPEFNFANSESQPGKPRFIDPMSYKFKFMQAPETFHLESFIQVYISCNYLKYSYAFKL